MQDIIQYDALAKILVHTSFGFRRIVNRAILLTQTPCEETERSEAQNELFLAFSYNMRGNKVNKRVCIEWLKSASAI